MTDVDTSATSLTVRRVIDAPQAQVWRAFTIPDELASWQSIGNLEVIVHQLDVTVGGQLALTHDHGSMRVEIEGEYLEVSEPERLVHTWRMVEGPLGDDETRITVELTPVDGGTEVVFTHDEIDPEVFDAAHVEGTAAGWVSMLNRLAATIDGGFDYSVYDTTIERTFDAPVERVWQAWTDPTEVSQWWGPTHFTVPHCEIELKSGGTYEIHMADPEGNIYPDNGEVVELDEPERLVLLSRAFETTDGHQLEVLNTITFTGRGEQTDVTLEAEVRKASPAIDDALGGMELGWKQSFSKLDTHLDVEMSV